MDTTLLERLPATWLETKLRERKIPWGVFILLICLLFLAIETPYSLRPDVNNFIGIALYDVAITAYVFTAWVITRYFLAQALKSIRPLIENYADSPLAYHREWQFIFGSAVTLTLITVFTTPVVNGSLGDITTWLYIFSQLVGNSMLGWLIFASLASANQVTHFISQVTVANIFDTSPYRPVAHWCLSAEISIMGAITIAILLLKDDMLSNANMIIYITAGLLGIFIFFAGMWSTHQHMLKNKECELKRINAELLALHHEIIAKVNNRELESSRALMEASAGLTSHKRVVEKAEEWPYTLGSLGGLATSLMVPIVINILSKIFR